MVNDFQSTVYGDFAADYESNRLADICNRKDGVQTGPFGSQLHQEDYVLEGTPIITVEHLDDNRILHSDVPCVSEKDCKRLCKYSLLKGDIVFSRVGSVDRRALVRDEENGWLFSGRCLRVRPNKEIIDPRYLSYFFGLPSFKEHIRAIAVGATMPSLNTKILSDVIIYYPPLPEQRAIAHILGTLDDKIELNRQMNETLEAMARAIFKSWFVDFDPVRAKAEGRDTGLPEEIAELFPDSFEETEMGEVPKGWQVKKIQEVVKCIKGKSYKSEHLQESQTALVTLKSFARGGGYRADGLKAYTGDYKPEQIVQPGELVIACTDVTQAAEVIGRPAIVESSDKFSIMIASLDVLIVRPSVKNITVPFLYCLFKTDRFADHTYAHSTGTTVLHLSKEAVPSYKFACPPEELHKRFASLTIPIFTRIDTIEQESRTLAELRDTLLPKLISGELRIKDAGEIIGNVPVE
ncbi:MAG: type restriction enzyme subunit [Methanolobus sp.]|nr:type restriction enzyme subunit [Methanolobus sp.]